MNKNISTTGLTAGIPLPGMARMVGLEIIIKGRIIRHFKYFRLDQNASTHHSFELTLPHDALDTAQDHRLSEAQHFLGKRITVVFRYRDTENDSPERTFVGVVTRVAFSQEQMSLGNIILKGGSPTLLLDAAPHFQSFGDEKPVNTAFIAQSIISQGLRSQKFDVRIDTQNKSYISYSAQYNETHYNYLARLAEAYGEQFYYDGEILHFGKLPPHEKPLTLTYGSSVNKVQVELNATYTQPRYFGYNNSTHQKMEGIDRMVKHPGELPAKAYELNQSIYKTDSFVPAPLAANVEMDVDDAQQSSRGSAATDVFSVSGETMMPFLYPGCVADLEMRKPDSNAMAYFTRVMITEVSHEVDARGNYKGSFKAIAEGTGFMPRPKFTVPKADPQVATVISNTDPRSQGRIRVRFQWQAGGSSTHFIRMMSPDAGGTGSVQQNRGFVAIPEVGDQVMVDFEYRHPDFPFAMGGMFHGKNGHGGGVDNHLKSIQTRSGIKVLMNDLDRSLTIEDPSGNSYFMDGKGNIRVTAPGNMEFSAGKDIMMSSGKNLEVKTGNSMEFMSGNLAAFHMMSGAVFSTPLMEMSVPVHLNIQSGKTSLLSEEETTIQGKTTHVAGMEKLMIHSEQETTVNSKGQTHVLGKDGNSHSNIPRDYNPLEKKMDGRCIVNFRPLDTWNGDGYGFDWVRAGDTGMTGDTDYLKIMGKIEDGRFIKDPSQYQRLISTFSHYIYNHTFEDGSTESRSYAFPYLSLYPKSCFLNSGGKKIKIQSPYFNTTAVLRAFVDIRESPEKITLQYDKKKFRVVHNPFPLAKGNHTLYFTITCLEEFDIKKRIEVFASYRNSQGRIRKVLAGGITVKPNHKRYDIPIVFIKVITNVGNGNRIPVIPQNIKREIQKYLNQALINPLFEPPLVLNCCTDTSAATGKKHMRQFQFNKYASPERNEEDMEDDIIYLNLNRNKTGLMNFLKNEIDVHYPGKYDNAIKVFFINELAKVGKGQRAGSGYANEKTVLLYYGGYDSPHITAHEIMHALGLKHTFSKESLFTFIKHQTDNIMDYSDNAEMTEHNISTYHWQWSTMQNHAQRELSPNNFVDYK